MAKKENQVTIVADELNNKIRISKNNAEYAHVLLRQDKTIIGSNGWINTRTLHTLLHGKVEAIKDLGISKMKYLPGQIVVTEQLTPFNEENAEQDYKYAGKTGVVCCVDGQPIYRKCFYDATGLKEDELIAHTNGDAIREANNKSADDILAKYPTVDPKQIDLEDSIAEAEEEEKSMISHEELQETMQEEDEVVVEDQGVEVEDNIVVAETDEEEVEVEEEVVFNL